MFHIDRGADLPGGIQFTDMPLPVIHRDRFDGMPRVAHVVQQRGGIHAAGINDNDFLHLDGRR